MTVDLGAIPRRRAGQLDCGARNVVYEMNSRVRAKKKKIEKRRKRKLGYGIDIPTHDEIRTIINHTAPRHKPLMITLVFTGMRSSELRGAALASCRLRTPVYSRLITRRPIRCYGLHEEPGRPTDNPGRTDRHQYVAGMEAPVPEGAVRPRIPERGGEPGKPWQCHQEDPPPSADRRGITVLKPKVDKKGNPVLDEQGEQIMETITKYSGLHAFRHFFASWCINRKSAGAPELTPKEVQHRMGQLKHSTDDGHLRPSISCGR